MLTHWKWFGEWSIGCIGILSDWVVETASTLCRAGETVLTLEALAKPAQRLAAAKDDTLLYATSRAKANVPGTPLRKDTYRPLQPMIFV